MRWIIRLGLTILVLAGILLAGLLLMPTDRIARFAESQFESATGRSLTLSGDVRPTLWPVIGVRTGPVEIANADWSQAGPMISAGALVIGLKPLPLLSGEIAIDELRIDAPRIRLERAADGRANWEMGAPGDAPAATSTDPDAASGAGDALGAPAQRFAFDKAVITDGEVTYTDHGAGTTMSLTALDLRAKLPDYDRAVKIDVSAQLNGREVELAALINGFGPFLAGSVRPVELDFGVGGNRIGFKGRAGLTPVALEGALDVDLPELDALFAALGQTPPDLPPGVGRNISVRGNVTYAGSAHLRGGVIEIDGNEIRGDADLTLEGRPKLVAKLTAGALDFSALAAGAGSGEASSAAQSSAAESPDGWPSDPIDVSALAMLDAEVALTAPSVVYGAYALERTDVVVRLERSRLALELREVGIYQGKITGDFVVNGRGGLSIGGDLDMRGVQLQPLLSAMAGYDRLLGGAGGHLKFLGVGASMDAIMKSLSGEGNIAIGKGELRGLDLAGMIRHLNASYRGPGAKTVFDAITASFTIADGVLTNDDLEFQGPVVDATGAGVADIGRQTVDYRLSPVAFARGDGSAASGGVRVPVTIKGRWSGPRIRPDLGSLIGGQLRDQTDALQDRAREELRGRAEDVVGPIGEGESVQDAVRSRVQDEVKSRLKNLLGGN